VTAWELSAAFAATAAFMVGMAVVARRTDVGRDNFRRMYVEERAPLFIRYAGAHLHLWAATFVGFAAIVFLPRVVGMPLSAVPLLLAAFTFALAYMGPTVQLPAWLRADIEAGRVHIARPTALDWVLFWMVVPLGVLAVISVPILSATETAVP
jgi:hypothetical protein